MSLNRKELVEELRLEPKKLLYCNSEMTDMVRADMSDMDNSQIHVAVGNSRNNPVLLKRVILESA